MKTDIAYVSKKTVFTEHELDLFLQNWHESYDEELKKIPLFNQCQDEIDWTIENKSYFAKIFYHARGHFYKFLWLLGNKAPDEKFKKIILLNIEEEFGGHAKSHEEMYFDFAEELGIDIRDEFVSETSYLDEIRKFNHSHISWLNNSSWPSCFSAFSAYERLDNIDYSALQKLAKSFGLSSRACAFFKIHAGVSHFETTKEELMHIWKSDPDLVKKAFNFIASHQLEMWRSLSYAMRN